MESDVNADMESDVNAGVRLLEPMSMRGRGRLTEAHRTERQEYLAPLFNYCAEHAILAIEIARRAARRQGEGMIRARLYAIKVGRHLPPTWFVAEMCREIGQPIETVMGQEWAQRHLTLPDAAPDGPVALPDGPEAAPEAEVA